MKLQPTSIATVWKSERIDAAFVWAPTLNKIKQTGRVIITSGQISQWGKATFDGLIVDKKWAKANPEFMVNFVRTIAAYDANYRTHRAAWSGTSNRVKKIAKLAGGNPIDIPHTLSLYKFPTIKQQASSRWLGGGALGGAARALRHTAKFLNKQKKLKNVLDDYGNAVNPQWVKAALRQ